MLEIAKGEAIPASAIGMHGLSNLASAAVELSLIDQQVESAFLVECDNCAMGGSSGQVMVGFMIFPVSQNQFGVAAESLGRGETV